MNTTKAIQILIVVGALGIGIMGTSAYFLYKTNPTHSEKSVATNSVTDDCDLPKNAAHNTFFINIDTPNIDQLKKSIEDTTNSFHGSVTSYSGGLYNGGGSYRPT